jgi:sugar (pentulose or hexulose) kinase
LGINNPETRTYSEEVIKLIGMEDYKHLLPPIIRSHEIAGYVTAEAAEATGLKKGTPVASGAWDCSSTALGVGGVNPGDAVSILGTAGIHQAVAGEPIANKAYSLYLHAVPGTYLINSMAMMAASCLNWFERTFCQPEVQEAQENGISKYDIINEKVAQVPVGSNGVIFLPFLQGERAPFVRSDARGEFFGLGNWTTKDDMLRAVYEGVALATLDNYNAIEQGIKIGEVWLAGGGAKSKVWAQIVSDCTGKVMKIPYGTEFGCRGAAMNAAIAAGFFNNHAEAAEAMVKVNRVHEPNLENTARYQELYAIYKDLIKGLWEPWRDMYNFVEKYREE